MTAPRRAPRRGFTLIEVMIAVAIVGLLASLAIPNFMRASLRARVSERAIIMDGIGRAISETVVNLQAFPDPSNQVTWTGPQNPPGPPTGDKRIFQQALGGWAWLPLVIEGATYYSYSFVATNPRNNLATLTVVAIGDLDGDGAISTKTVNWVSRGWLFAKVAGGEVPPAGMEDLNTFNTF